MTASPSLNSSDRDDRLESDVRGLVSATSRGLMLPILVKPGARSSAILGIHDGRLRIQVKALPVKGAANEAVIRFLATQLGLKRDTMEIVAGRSSRRKTLHITSGSRDDMVSILHTALISGRA